MREIGSNRLQSRLRRKSKKKRVTGEIDAKNVRGEIWNGSRTVTSPGLSLSLLAAYHIYPEEKKKIKRDLDDRLELVSTRSININY